MTSLERCLLILLYFQVGRTLAIELCYNSVGSYQGYCNDGEECCNGGYNCCDKVELAIGAIVGLVITGIFIVVFIAICARIIYVKKYRRTPVGVAPIIHTTTVQNTNTQMYPHPPMGGPNPPMGAPVYPPPHAY